MAAPDWDFVIIGSGFGGSVCALRLVEKGHKVLLLEKGKRFRKEDFADSNWDARRWYWLPEVGLTGIFQMSLLRHVTVLHGVGYGGGSLTYANTLPRPKSAFFTRSSWNHLADWETELAPHYTTAERMLGAVENPQWTRADDVIAKIAKDMGRSDAHHKTNVAVFFGEPGAEVTDPYFNGDGPARTGCTFCGACMTGCKVGAKNTLDQNYLFLAEKKGLTVRTETTATAVREHRDTGYVVDTCATFSDLGDSLHTRNVVFAGGVMGTVPLLLRMRDDDILGKLSPRVGDFVRTNSESLSGVVTPNDAHEDFSQGVAITSILHTSDDSHLEPVRYAPGSGIFRLGVLPHAPGDTVRARLKRVVGGLLKEPLAWMKAYTVSDFAKQSLILLYMRTLEGTLRLRLRRGVFADASSGVTTELPDGQEPPRTFMPEATELLERVAKEVNGVPMSLVPETLMGVPTTAHILGGACMGATATDGVIDAQHRVHGYPGLFVVDGSAVSANPGVNPALTITAMAERAMSFIAAKSDVGSSSKSDSGA